MLIGLIVLVVLVTHRAHSGGNPSDEAACQPHSVVEGLCELQTIDLKNPKVYFLMELIYYLIFLDRDKMYVYRDKSRKFLWGGGRLSNTIE